MLGNILAEDSRYNAAARGSGYARRQTSSKEQGRAGEKDLTIVSTGTIEEHIQTAKENKRLKPASASNASEGHS